MEGMRLGGKIHHGDQINPANAHSSLHDISRGWLRHRNISDVLVGLKAQNATWARVQGRGAEG
jgi:hypothetical protein